MIKLVLEFENEEDLAPHELRESVVENLQILGFDCQGSITKN